MEESNIDCTFTCTATSMLLQRWYVHVLDDVEINPVE